MTRLVIGGAVILASAGIGGWYLLREFGNPFQGEPSSVTTRASGDGVSRAQQIQELEGEKAELESRIDSLEREIENEYQARVAKETWEGINDRVKRECEGEWGLFNPWGECDDRVMEQVKVENRQWRDDQIAERVEPLRVDLRRVESELESLYMTA